MSENKKQQDKSTDKAATEVNNGQEQEIGGFEDKFEPTTHNDWQVNGRASDF